MKTLIIIPARYASERFPGKPLALIHGAPMIQWVYQRVRQSKAEAVIVATDDERIRDAVLRFDGQVVMTSPAHSNGTSRCRELAEREKGFDLIINVQGDEPLISPTSLDDMIDCLKHGHKIVSLYHTITQGEENDPNRVKVVMDCNDRALYFSRSVIPYARNNEDMQYYQHVGVYGFHRSVLLELGNVPTGVLARSESLEQLSWLEKGYSIQMRETKELHQGIDTEEDLKWLEAYILRKGISLDKFGF